MEPYPPTETTFVRVSALSASVYGIGIYVLLALVLAFVTLWALRGNPIARVDVSFAPPRNGAVALIQLLLAIPGIVLSALMLYVNTDALKSLVRYCIEFPRQVWTVIVVALVELARIAVRKIFIQGKRGVENSMPLKIKPHRRLEMKEFKFRLPFLLGVVLTVAVSVLFPAKASVAARALDLPALLGMPLGDALMWLASASVLGALLTYALGYLRVAPEKIPYIVNVVVGIVGAALTAGVKFVPPDVLGMSVYQAVLAFIAFVAGLAGVRAAALAQAAQLKRALCDPTAALSAANEQT